MTDRITKTVLPEDIDVKGHFFGTEWQNCEKEVIAHNIVLNAQNTKAGWSLGFTWEEYQKSCTHKTTYSEHGVICQLARERYLVLDDDRFFVNDRFLSALSKWWKHENADTANKT